MSTLAGRGGARGGQLPRLRRVESQYQGLYPLRHSPGRDAGRLRRSPAMGVVLLSDSVRTNTSEGPKADGQKMTAQKVGTRGFEPPTSSSRTRRATRLRYVPTEWLIIAASRRLSALAWAQVTIRSGVRDRKPRRNATRLLPQVLQDQPSGNDRARQSDEDERYKPLRTQHPARQERQPGE